MPMSKAEFLAVRKAHEVVSGITSDYIEIERRAELFTSSANIAIVRVFVLNIFVSLCR